MLSKKAKQNKLKYDTQYKKEHLKRIPLEVTPGFYEQIKNSANMSGDSVNGFIKKAISEKIEKINKQ